MRVLCKSCQALKDAGCVGLPPSCQYCTEIYEKVSHPVHYGGADNPYEAIKVIEAWELGFNLGTVVRYISRHGKKPGETAIEDLQKASWYLNREIENLKK